MIYWAVGLLLLQIQMWSFCPLEEKTYTIKPTLTFWSIQSDGSNKAHLALEVVGIGSKGSLQVGLSLAFKHLKFVFEVSESIPAHYQVHYSLFVTYRVLELTSYWLRSELIIRTFGTG